MLTDESASDEFCSIIRLRTGFILETDYPSEKDNPSRRIIRLQYKFGQSEFAKKRKRFLFDSFERRTEQDALFVHCKKVPKERDSCLKWLSTRVTFTSGRLGATVLDRHATHSHPKRRDEPKRQLKETKPPTQGRSLSSSRIPRGVGA